MTWDLYPRATPTPGIGSFDLASRTSWVIRTAPSIEISKVAVRPGQTLTVGRDGSARKPSPAGSSRCTWAGPSAMAGITFTPDLYQCAINYVGVTDIELLFETISQCYERGSVIITSNLPFDEWTEIFGSERLTGALLDRLTHHVHILEMNGESFRLKESKKRQKSKN